MYQLTANSNIFTGIVDTPGEGIIICPKHRDSLGIYWRGRQRNCQIPQSIAAHCKSAKGDRSVNKETSLFILKEKSSLVPVGSGIKYKRVKIC